MLLPLLYRRQLKNLLANLLRDPFGRPDGLPDWPLAIGCSCCRFDHHVPNGLLLLQLTSSSLNPTGGHMARLLMRSTSCCTIYRGQNVVVLLISPFNLLCDWIAAEHRSRGRLRRFHRIAVRIIASSSPSRRKIEYRTLRSDGRRSTWQNGAVAKIDIADAQKIVAISNWIQVKNPAAPAATRMIEG